MSKGKRICFVCLGNIVRSPLAEHMFMRHAREAGVAEKYEVRSAGTGAWHIGEEPDARMRRVAARYGLEYTGRAAQFLGSDFNGCDLIIAMDRENRADLLALARSPEAEEKVRLLREFDPQGGPNAAVPDPYYGGLDGFEEVYRIIERATRGLLEALEAGEI